MSDDRVLMCGWMSSLRMMFWFAPVQGDYDVYGCHFVADVFEWDGDGVHVFCEAF